MPSSVVLEEPTLILVELRGVELIFVGDGCLVNQKSSQNRHFLIRRVLMTFFGHDEGYLSIDKMFKSLILKLLRDNSIVVSNTSKSDGTRSAQILTCLTRTRGFVLIK